MAGDTPAILTAEFEPLARPLDGFVMRISGTARNYNFRTMPFFARVGDQQVESLTWNLRGDRFAGYLRRMPNSGDRLFVGYGAANQPTPITFHRRSEGSVFA